MENSAFSRVVFELHSSSMALAGTPLAISTCHLFVQSPVPLTTILGAVPEWNSSAARDGRSNPPPPNTTSASAWTSPLSTHNICRGKLKPAKARAASKLRIPITNLPHIFFLAAIRNQPHFSQTNPRTTARTAATKAAQAEPRTQHLRLQLPPPISCADACAPPASDVTSNAKITLTSLISASGSLSF
jgi:hypothetical protein